MTDSELVREIAQPLSGGSNDYDALLGLIDDARFVLIGEATHGTHEFYSERATITKRLIAEKGFSILAIEADWPDSARVHRYVRGLPAVADATADTNADQALSGFRQFPTWMWRNTVVVEFVEWLRGFNKNVDWKRAPVGFCGMDLYSLHASIDAVLQYLDKADPEAARRARLRYSCFDHFSRKPQEYGYATTVGAIESCEKAVVEQLVELQQQATFPLWRRPRHYGEVNVGQLVRERFGKDAVLIGFTTHYGTVTAASDWGAPAERKNVRPALRGSYEELFHETGLPPILDRFAGCRPDRRPPTAPDRARNRCDLSAGKRTVEPLFSRAAPRTIRCGHSHR